MRQQVWRIGNIDGTNYADSAPLGKARVKLTDKQPGILTQPLPVLFPLTGTDKAYYMPKIGDRVVILTDENCEDGIILGSFYTEKNQPPEGSVGKHLIEFEDGTKLEYDKTTKFLTFDVQGGIKLIGENGINIEWSRENQTLNINIEGNLNITSQQNITLNGSNIYLN